MGVVGGTIHKSQGLETPNGFFFFPELPLPPSPPPTGLPSPTSSHWWPAANTGHTVRIQASRPPGPVSLPLAFPMLCSLATSFPPPMMNRVDLFLRLRPSAKGGRAKGLGARSSPAPTRPSVPWPLALLGHPTQGEDRCAC